MRFRLARNEDLPAILDIVIDAKEKLKKQGSDQWQNGYPNEATFKEDINNQILYVGLIDMEVVAVFAVTNYEEAYDHLLNGKWEYDDEYLVCHRLAIKKEYQNKRLGYEVFRFIENLALFKGIKELRVDTHYLNEPMRRLVSGFGFRQIGEAMLFGNARRLAFEKRCRKRKIIFDMDGTLIDSMTYWYETGKEAILEFFNDDFETIEMMAEMSAKEVMQYISGKMSIEDKERLSASWNKKMVELYRTKIELKPYVLEYLKELKEDGALMCVATATPIDMATEVLDRLGIKEFFSFVIDEAEVGVGKHEPKIYLECAKRLGSNPNEIEVYEDNYRFARVAKEANFIAVGVYDELSANYEEEMKSFCDIYIHSFKELLKK